MKKIGFIALLSLFIVFSGCNSIFKSLDKEDGNSEEVVEFNLEENLNQGNFDSVLDSVDDEIANDAELSDINTDIAISTDADNAQLDADQLQEESTQANADALNADADISTANSTIEIKNTELTLASSNLDGEILNASTDEQTVVNDISALVDSDEELISLEGQVSLITERSQADITFSSEEIDEANLDLSNAEDEISGAEESLASFSLNSTEEAAITIINNATKVIAIAKEKELTIEILDNEISSLENQKLTLENQIANAQSSLSINRVNSRDTNLSLAALIARLNNITTKLDNKTLEKENANKSLKHYNVLKKEAEEKKQTAISKLRTDVADIINSKTTSEIKKGLAELRKDLYTIKKSEAQKQEAEAKAALQIKKIEKTNDAINKIIDKGDQINDALEAALNAKLKILKEKAEAEKLKAEAEKAKAKAAELSALASKANKDAIKTQEINTQIQNSNQSQTGYITNPTSDPLVEKWLNQKEGTKTLMGYNLTKAKALLGKANVTASNVLDTLIELNNNSVGSDTNVNLTDIVTTYTEQHKSYLAESLALYKGYLPDPAIFKEDKMKTYPASVKADMIELKEYTKNFYLGAGVAIGIDTANILLKTLNRYNNPNAVSVFYLNEDGIKKSVKPLLVNDEDKFPNENKTYLPGKSTIKELSSDWISNRDSIILKLTKTKKFAKAYFGIIDFNEYNSTGELKEKVKDNLSQNEDLIITLEEIIGELSDQSSNGYYNMTNEDHYNRIIDEVLSAVN